MDVGGAPRRRGRVHREVARMPRERRATWVRSARAAGRRGVPVDVAPESSRARRVRPHRQMTSTDIEDRKQAEEKLRQDERELRRVIDTIPSLAWSTLPDGSGEFWNKRWYDYSGLTPEECVGSGWHRGVHPEDVTPLMNKWAEVLASGEAGEGEARFRRHDGVFRWFLIRAAPLRDETGRIVRWYGISTDIEDRKQAEEKLRQEERELRQITDAIPEMIVVHEPDGTLIYANERVLDHT